MRITITGASGFVGKALSRVLLDQGHEVIGLGTSPTHPLESEVPFTWYCADTTRTGTWQTAVSHADAVINLAGRTIFKRWTRSYKAQIIDSRVRTTENIVSAMNGSDQILVSTSAVGYYGSRGEETLTETSAPGEGFLARVAVEWERAARVAENRGARVAIMRFGVVLGEDGGALSQMIPAFKMFAGGPLGRGRQWFPWIHMHDLLAAVQFLLSDDSRHGAYNFCAPGTVRQKDFAKALGAVLGRPALVPAPTAALRLIMGEMADMLLTSQRALPDRLLDEGFDFRFPRIDEALADLVQPS